MLYVVECWAMKEKVKRPVKNGKRKKLKLMWLRYVCLKGCNSNEKNIMRNEYIRRIFE